MSAPVTESQKADSGASVAEPRRETFLALYPRKLKMGVLAGFVVVLVGFWMVLGSSSQQKKGPHVSMATSINGVDAAAAIANPGQADISSPSKEEPDSSESIADASENDGSSGLMMTPAPAPGLSEDAPQGTLPRISEDGRVPWQVYARPFNMGDKRPRVAIVITDLGLARVPSDAAITRLPPNVTLAFDAQSPVVGAWVARARQAGHETLLTLPMEPFDYPRSDPGPNTLLSNLPNSDNIQRLLVFLAQATGYVGVTSISGSHFTTDPQKITPILEVLHQRGLMIFDARAAPHSAIADLARDNHVPVAIDTLQLDQNLSPAALDESLTRLEQTARLNGHAIAMAPPVPVVIDRLEVWIKQLARDGIVLAPLTAMVQ